MTKKAKVYPLSIESLHEDGGGCLGYYSKGHHDFSLFRAEVLKECEVEIPADDLIRHIYYRCGFMGDMNYSEFTHYYFEYNTPGRGRFPVTLWEEYQPHKQRQKMGLDKIPD